MSDLGWQQTPLPRWPVLLVENQVTYGAYKPLSRYRGVPPCWSLAGPAEWQVCPPLGSAGAYATSNLSGWLILPPFALRRRHVGLLVEDHKMMGAVLRPLVLSSPKQIHIHCSLHFVHRSLLFSRSPFSFLQLFSLAPIFFH